VDWQKTEDRASNLKRSLKWFEEKYQAITNIIQKYMNIIKEELVY